jgi:hypothetical protein
MLQNWRKTKLQKRAKSKKKKQREHSMLTKQILVGLSLVCVIGLLITAVWYGSRIESLQVTNVSVVGGYTIPHSYIKDIAFSQMEGTYFKLVPKTFSWTYPRKAITTQIEDMPRMKHVRIEKSSKQEITIAFEEYRPHALWCEDAEVQRCMFLDEFGFSFSKAPELAGGVFVRYIENDRHPEEKTQAFGTDFIKQTNEFAEKLAKELDLYVVSIEKVEDLDILYTVSGGGLLKVSQMMSPEDSFKNLRSILGSEDFIHLQNGKFQYIDLRFGDKIFLNEEDTSVATSSASEEIDS